MFLAERTLFVCVCYVTGLSGRRNHVPRDSYMMEYVRIKDRETLETEQRLPDRGETEQCHGEQQGGGR